MENFLRKSIPHKTISDTGINQLDSHDELSADSFEVI
jgi:hypothetical protein